MLVKYYMTNLSNATKKHKINKYSIHSGSFSASRAAPFNPIANL